MYGLVKLALGNMIDRQFNRATRERGKWKSMVDHNPEDMAQW